MNPRTLVNIFLLLFVAGLALLVYHLSNDGNSAQRLTSLQRDAIDSIVIPRDKGDIVLEKNRKEWRMLSPYPLRAHAFRIERLLDLAVSETEKSYRMDKRHAEQYGLNENSTRIRFNRTLLHFGFTNPINGKRYVRVDDRLLLVDDQLFPLLNSQPSSFVDLALLGEQQTLREIRLPGLVLSKDTRGRWQTDPPGRGDADSIRLLIENWQSAQAFGVHAYMQRKQLGDIELHLSDGTLMRLVISDRAPWLILGNPELGVEYHFDKSFDDTLLKLKNSSLIDGKPDA